MERFESVVNVTYPIFDVIIVDNGSTDDLAAVLSAQFPEVQLIRVQENRYYAGGNHVGIRHALAAGVKQIISITLWSIRNFLGLSSR